MMLNYSLCFKEFYDFASKVCRCSSSIVEMYLSNSDCILTDCTV